MHVHDLVPFHTTEFDISHKIHKLSFGHVYPGMHNPLDHIDVPRVNPRNPEGSTGMYQYFLKVRSRALSLSLSLSLSISLCVCVSVCVCVCLLFSRARALSLTCAPACFLDLDADL
jgi:hypothetical protein